MDELDKKIEELLLLEGAEKGSFDADLISQMIKTSLRFVKDQHSTAQLKLVNRALKELRYAYHIFNQYPEGKKLSIFGSARTPEDHRDYKAAKNFSSLMNEKGWRCITGAADGIMKAGHEGAPIEDNFGLSIKLAFESSANPYIEGDLKHITFHYFFTRKLMFLSHSDAVAVFPGGVGTQDELFEVLTLMQTGKSPLIPLVLMEGEGGTYWSSWKKYVEENLLGNGWISEDDLFLFYIAKDPQDGVDHIQQFYKNYHSSRFVKNKFVIRMQHLLSQDQLETLQEKFSDLLLQGTFEQGGPLVEEGNIFLQLPRLVFDFDKRQHAKLRRLIDQLNAFLAPMKVER